jgi:hypothetical protein
MQIEKLMVPSESASQELSNEWSCQYVSTILNVLANFFVLALVTEVIITDLPSRPILKKGRFL